MFVVTDPVTTQLETVARFFIPLQERESTLWYKFLPVLRFFVKKVEYKILKRMFRVFHFIHKKHIVNLQKYLELPFILILTEKHLFSIKIPYQG